ncbi:MAG: protein-tyrosine-phosphatase [Planctomycetota bacterium]
MSRTSILALPLFVCFLAMTAGRCSASENLFDQVRGQTRSISEERRDTLSKLAASISKSIEQHGKARVTFICTHNSRRSQFSQAWLHAAVEHVGLGDKVQIFSGGTESTACNPRTVSALKRAGFDFDVKSSEGENPTYSAIDPKFDTPLLMFSKVFDKAPNPTSNFIAVMCCGDADEKCPVVQGAADRIALHYVDPKVSDGTAEESKTYDERCRQIGSEMYFAALQIADRLDANSKSLAK